jgi:hypothetical protein
VEKGPGHLGFNMQQARLITRDAAFCNEKAMGELRILRLPFEQRLAAIKSFESRRGRLNIWLGLSAVPSELARSDDKPNAEALGYCHNLPSGEGLCTALPPQILMG